MLHITLYYAPYCIPQRRCTKCFSHLLLGCRGGDTEKVLESECVFIRQRGIYNGGCSKAQSLWVWTGRWQSNRIFWGHFFEGSVISGPAWVFQCPLSNLDVLLPYMAASWASITFPQSRTPPKPDCRTPAGRDWAHGRSHWALTLVRSSLPFSAFGHRRNHVFSIANNSMCKVFSKLLNSLFSSVIWCCK